MQSRFFKAMVTGVILASGVLPFSGAKAQETPTTANSITTEDCFLHGTSKRLRCSTMMVPLYHDDPSRGEIEIFAAVMPALSGKPEADPLVLFAGGPGQAASDLVPIVSGVLRDIWQDRDILLIDQRGTGKSTPLDCDLDPEEGIASEEEARALIAECHKEQTVDTRAFNLGESVHDIALMVKALGYQQVNTYGISYGTRTSAYFYRTYPDLVRSVTVDAVAPPDYSLFLNVATAAQTAMTALIEDCEQSSSCANRFPNLRDNLNSYLSAARDGTLRYVGKNPMTGEDVDEPISELAAVESLRSVLYGVSGTTILPYAIERAAKGDLTVVLNQGFIPPGRGRMYLGMTLSFLCSEDLDRTTASEARAAAENTFTSDSFYRNFENLCGAWSYLNNASLPQDMFLPWEGDKPVLVLTGALDPITPPVGGDHIVKTLSNARHIVVPGTGHGTFRVPCIPFLMQEFLDTLDLEALDTSCTERVKRAPILIGPNGQTLSE